MSMNYFTTGYMDDIGYDRGPVRTSTQRFVGKHELEKPALVMFEKSEKGLFANVDGWRVYPDRSTDIKEGLALVTHLNFKENRKGIFAFGKRVVPEFVEVTEELALSFLSKAPDIDKVYTRISPNGIKFITFSNYFTSSYIIINTGTSLEPFPIPPGFGNSTEFYMSKVVTEKFEEDFSGFVTKYTGRKFEYLQNRLFSGNGNERLSASSEVLPEPLKRMIALNYAEFFSIHNHAYNGNGYCFIKLNRLAKEISVETLKCLAEHNKAVLSNIKKSLKKLGNVEVISAVSSILNKHPDWKTC